MFKIKITIYIRYINYNNTIEIIAYPLNTSQEDNHQDLETLMIKVRNLISLKSLKYAKSLEYVLKIL